MSVTVHGRPGWSLRSSGDGKYGSEARRGAFHEEQVARALERWLTKRPDHAHLFHDLLGFDKVTGAGLASLSLGTANIDHLVLTGARWLMIDAKGCGAGTLGLDPHGKGVMVKPDGTCVPQPWLDERRSYSLGGIPYRLTDGITGLMAWITPDTTLLHPSLRTAACMRRGGVVLPMRALTDGYFDHELPPPQPAADAAHIARFSEYLSYRG
ncbi:nuclease-related domain-containing protein [Nonomuraea polychroma]|uniref:nuclease-related domain-containing protein n=1 Tax=Nonomuraea polychroma TaxID=46176 RepID=UPI003D93D392